MTATTAPTRRPVLDAPALLARVADVGTGSLPPAALRAAGALVLDALGLAAAAPTAPAMAPTSAARARLVGRPGADGIHVPFGAPAPGPAEAAAGLSVAIHAWDFDDTHDDAVVHTACVALPAALATAQECGADGADVLAGVVAGVEVLSRLSLAVGPRPGVVRTAGLGALGAAAATARVLGLDADRTGAALALALPAALAPTSRQVVVDSAVNKRHQPAVAVHAGVGAAYLAAAGVDGPAGWWDGPHGLGADAAGDPRRVAAAGWEVERLSLKPIPACRYAHAAVAGVLDLTGARAHDAADAPRVRVRLPVGSNHAMVARPFERRGTPIVDAQFSVPWLVAAALLRGKVGLTELAPDVLADPAIEQVARDRVTVVQDQDPGGLGTSVMTPVEVEVDGVRRRLDRVPGSPEQPLTEAEQQRKLRDCLDVAPGDHDSAAGASALTALVADLPELSPTDLVARLRAATPGQEAR